MIQFDFKRTHKSLPATTMLNGPRFSCPSWDKMPTLAAFFQFCSRRSNHTIGIEWNVDPNGGAAWKLVEYRRRSEVLFIFDC